MSAAATTIGYGTGEPVLAVDGLSKRYGPRTLALADASLSVRPGEVHCLLGANGAGKSTLLKILAGAVTPSSGSMRVAGRPFAPRSPSAAAAAGISMIYQELDLVPQLSVEANMMLGHAPARYGVLLKRRRTARARAALERVGARFAPGARVGSLSLANQQLTAIARSLTREARLIIMDEPSAALNESELERVFEVVRGLCREGVAIVYVSHRLGEIRDIGDRVTVLRDGRTIDTFDVDRTGEGELVEAIIGRKRAQEESSPRRRTRGREVLRVRRMRGEHGLDVTDLALHEGEILGLSGLNGSGRTSFLHALFGDRAFSGEVLLRGEPYAPDGPADAIRRGVGLVPEDRKTEGLILDAAIFRNATLSRLGDRLLARNGARLAEAVPVLDGLATKHDSPLQPVGQLSGGNQQKVVLSKWVIAGSTLLLLDEPSRGLDIGAKADLYALVERLARERGFAVIVASSELDELYASCDAIWVFHEGRNLHRFVLPGASREQILKTTILGEHR